MTKVRVVWTPAGRATPVTRSTLRGWPVVFRFLRRLKAEKFEVRPERAVSAWAATVVVA